MPSCRENQLKEDQETYGIDIAEFLRLKRKPPKCRKCERSFWGLKLYIYKYCHICWVNMIADGLKKKKK